MTCAGQRRSHAAANFGMRPFEKFFEKPKLLHDLHRGRMHRITAKITQKVRMLFHDHRFYARARKKIAQHHACRAASGNTALND
jgi:hypothetical protein